MTKSIQLLILVFIARLFVSPDISAQQTADDNFYIVREMVKESKLEQALEKIEQLSEENPANLDYKIYLGRIHAWLGNYQTSEKLLRNLYQEFPANEEIYLTLLNTLFWSGQYEATSQLVKQGLNKFPENATEIKLIKLKVLLQLEQKKEGLELISTLREAGMNETELAYIETQFLKMHKNLLSVQAVNSSFTNAVVRPWFLSSVSYLRKWEKSPTEFKVNYGNIADSRDVMFEVESYPIINKRGYLYTNLGLSNNNIFPGLKAGLEYFHEFKRGLSFSGGARYMEFKFVGEPIYIFTGHVGKTFQTFNFQYRPFFSLQNNEFLPSHTVLIKKNWFAKESFLQLDLQYGTIPYYFYISDDFSRVASTRFGLQYQLRVASNWLILAGVLYEYEEYSPENYRNRINISLKLTKRF